MLLIEMLKCSKLKCLNVVN
ncbi:hypothetical protein F383_38576 [Gossypium arboreum]|uniref:Uncharacterized protein n=1 Tax=Gossypium arboreum TaxID=29729 RepID=A0A0B0MH97_GOSAR|nr:hypothetical protein F383_38576 [Gossypium arboreum]